MNIHVLLNMYFTDPSPSVRDILDSTSAFSNAINMSLKMGLNRGCRVTVNFPTDVFRFLFKDKGSDYPHGAGHLYTFDHFDKTFSDRLVQGTRQTRRWLLSRVSPAHGEQTEVVINCIHHQQ